MIRPYFILIFCFNFRPNSIYSLIFLVYVLLFFKQKYHNSYNANNFSSYDFYYYLGL
jgi:hypothetical protein